MPVTTRMTCGNYTIISGLHYQTNSSHLKMDGWKMIVSSFHLGQPHFQVLLLLVSGRVLIQNYSDTWWGGVKFSPLKAEPPHKVFGCPVVFLLSTLPSLTNESVTWLLYNAKEEKYRQVIGGIPKWVAQTPWLWVHVSAMCAMIKLGCTKFHAKQNIA